jgi:hypothetical protein
MHITIRRQSAARTVLLFATSALLLALAWTVLGGAARQLERELTVWQQVETVVQLGCGVLTLLLVPTYIRPGRWATPVRAGWVGSLAVAAGLSGLVWGPPMPLTALLFTLLSVGVGLAVLRVLHLLLSGDSPTP